MLTGPSFNIKFCPILQSNLIAHLLLLLFYMLLLLLLCVHCRRKIHSAMPKDPENASSI